MNEKKKPVTESIKELGKAQLEGVTGRLVAVATAIGGALYMMDLPTWSAAFEKVLNNPKTSIGLVLVGLGAWYQRRK